MEEISPRERFKETFTFGKPDRVFFMPHWFWSSTIARWHSEGLPRDIYVDEFFGFDRYEFVPVNLGFIPPFEYEVYFENGEYRVYRRYDGCKVKEFKRYAEASMPHWLEYPIKTRLDWEREVMPRLNPRSPARYPLWWDDYVRWVKNRDYPLGISAGSYYGWIRNWMGIERLSRLIYEDPEFIRKIADYIADFVIETIRRAVEEIELDFAIIWEDMAMKTGPLISPRKFKELMIPACKRVCDYLHSNGIEIILLDSDGFIDQLIPIWLDAGVTGVYPLEVAAGENVVSLRKKYGRRLAMFGGVDKRVLARDHEEVERHLFQDLKLPWMLMQGGYTPLIDHAVPPDVRLENFMHYWSIVKDVARDPFKYLDRCGEVE
ncbi:MAG: uroporphyrinogen decarboxylase family protein [Thermoproteota archaeon]